MFNKTQEHNFLKMLAWMEMCGNMGHYSSFQMMFDGDGTAKIHCNFEDEETQKEYNSLKKELLEQWNKGKELSYIEFGL